MHDFRNSVIAFTDRAGHHHAFTIQDIIRLEQDAKGLYVYFSGEMLTIPALHEIEEEIIFQYEDAHGTDIPRFHRVSADESEDRQKTTVK